MGILDSLKKKALEAELRVLAKSSFEIDVKEYGVKLTIAVNDVEQLVTKVLQLYEAKRKES